MDFLQQINSLHNPINIDKMTNLFNRLDEVTCYEHMLLMLTLYPAETNMIYENGSTYYNIQDWDGIFRYEDDNTTQKEMMDKVCDIVCSTEHKNGKLSLLIKRIINDIVKNAKRSVICNFI